MVSEVCWNGCMNHFFVIQYFNKTVFSTFILFSDFHSRGVLCEGGSWLEKRHKLLIRVSERILHL